MVLSLHAPSHPFRALGLGLRAGPAALLGRRQARAAASLAEEAVARLPPHMLVDIGLLAEAPGPRPVPPAPVLPPASAMQRRGDWGAGPPGPDAWDPASAVPCGPCWTWPMRP